MGNIFDILGPVMVGPSSSHTGSSQDRYGCKTVVRPSAGEGRSLFTWFFLLQQERGMERTGR